MPRLLTGESLFSGDIHICVQSASHEGRVQTHTHNFHEMVYVADGFALHMENSASGVMNLITPGDLFFIKPGEEHSYIYAHRPRLFNMLFQPEEVERFFPVESRPSALTALFDRSPADATTALPHIERFLRIPLPARRGVEIACERMEALCLRQPPSWEDSLRVQFAAFLSDYARMHAEQWDNCPPNAGNYGVPFYKTLLYIATHYAEPITMRALSDISGLSPDYMARKFKQVLGMTPSSYLRKYRVARAMEFLCTTDKSVRTIAAETGFSDIALFSRVFKETVGIPPTQYRRRNAWE